MPCKIVWLKDSVRDLQRLREFLTPKSPIAARRASQRIIDATNILIENPEAGKPVLDLPAYRDLYINFGNGGYVLRYRKETGHIYIVRVKHTKEDKFSAP